MKTLAKIFLIALLGTSLLQAVAFEKVLSSSAAKITLSSDKPLATGSNTFTIVVADDVYKDAEVSIKIFMPAMPGMPYMESVADAKNIGNGAFVAKVNLAMSGTWQVHIFVTPKTGKKIRVKTSLNI